MDDKKGEKGGNLFYCKYCDVLSCDKWKYERHKLTAKHKKRTKGGQKGGDFLEEPSNDFVCECGKKYKYRQGLWKHFKLCKLVESNYSDKDTLIQTIINENKEVKQLLLEQNMKILELSTKNNTIINNTTHNTTNNFNLQLFLNVQCKDAINITDFVDSLQVQIKDLEDVGRNGYIEGISKIFINGLKGLDINKRPIHCSDLKRETIYIKDKDMWEKENEERNKLKFAIKTITSKNIKQIPIWQKENPECFDTYSKKNDQYLKIVSNAMNGATEEETQKNYEKIISKVVKEVTIQKDQI